MSKFERQLRLWGDYGQTRIERCAVVVDYPPAPLIQEILISLSLAGLDTILGHPHCQPVVKLNHFCPPIQDFESFDWGVGISEVVYIESNGQSGDPEDILRLNPSLIVRVRRRLPVFFARFDSRRSRLILAHQLTAKPPFSLLAIPELLTLCEKWLTEPYRTLKVPWLLILVHSARELLKGGRLISADSLRSQIMSLRLDEESLKQSRLHMSWILNAPDLASLSADARRRERVGERTCGFDEDPDIASEDAELLTKLLNAPRMPVTGQIPDDEACDAEPWAELQALLIKLRDDDTQALGLESFLAKKGLGTLEFAPPPANAENEEFCAQIKRRELVSCLGVNSEHPLSSILATEKSMTLNNTILHGLAFLSAAQDEAELAKFVEALREDFPEFRDELFVQNFSIPESFITAFASVVAGSISTEILKVIVRQFTVKFGAVVYDVRNSTSVYLPTRLLRSRQR